MVDHDTNFVKSTSDYFLSPTEIPPDPVWSLKIPDSSLGRVSPTSPSTNKPDGKGGWVAVLARDIPLFTFEVPSRGPGSETLFGWSLMDWRPTSYTFRGKRREPSIFFGVPNLGGWGTLEAVVSTRLWTSVRPPVCCPLYDGYDPCFRTSVTTSMCPTSDPQNESTCSFFFL